MKCGRFSSFVLVAVLAFFSGLFITVQNSSALDTVILPSSPIRLCGTNTSVLCSDYSFIHLIYTYQPISLQSFISVISSGYSFTRINIPPSSYSFSFSDLDFYIPIPSDSSYISLEFSSTNQGTISYELLTGVSSGVSPSGNIDISSNGTYDVTNYASATVNVPVEVIQGDYHDDLIAINNSILICAAVCLVIYFFYCIYRLIIKNSGVH